MTPILSLTCHCGKPKKSLETKYCPECRTEADKKRYYKVYEKQQLKAYAEHTGLIKK